MKAGIIAGVGSGSVWSGVASGNLSFSSAHRTDLFFHPARLSAITAASSLFRPRRLTQVSGGVFYLVFGNNLAERNKPRMSRDNTDHLTREEADRKLGTEKLSAARWQVEGHKARLADAPVEAAIDLAHPERGLSVNVPDAPKTGPRLSVLGFVLGDAGQRDRVEIDAYVRQSDLIATFERAAPHPMRAQVYWRWLEPSEFAPDFAAAVLVAFDLISSVNTSLLDVDPVSSAGSSAAMV